MPGFNLYSSNRLENLVTILAEILKEPLNSPLEQNIIVIQNRGMERWLSMQLASQLGIWANCRYPFPNAFLHDLFTTVIPDFPDHLQSDPEFLVWKIMHILPDLLSKECFKPLNHYLADNSQIKLFQLSKKIADMFDQYSIYRPEMLHSWELNQENDWQAELWRSIFSENSIHRAKLKQLFIEKLAENSFPQNLFPEQINIFGISALPPYHTELFYAVSSVTNVNFFVLNPCAEYWDDIFSEKEISRILKKKLLSRKSKSATKTSLHLDQGNSLLSSWGKYGRDFLSRLHQHEPEEYSIPVEYQTETLLSMLQSDILNLHERGTPDYPPLPVRPDDCSIQIHSCHSPMREVEILHDNILKLFKLKPELQPSDIVVMSPDIETYAPYIDAVFGSVQEPNLKIPYSLADRSMRVESIIAETFLALLELPDSRFTVSSILDILETQEVQAAFSISENDLALIKNWINDTGIRWGIDSVSKEKLNLPAFEENTWSCGLKRLLLGFSLPSQGRHSFENISGYDHLEGSQSEILGNLLDFVETLVHFTTLLSQNHTLTEWSSILCSFLNRMFKTDHENEKDLITIRSSLTELTTYETELNLNDTYSLDVIKSWITWKLQNQSLRPGFITGGLTFCAMMPMRSIPFKIICILGLNDDSFPRKSSHFSWDLIAANPRSGDRSLELEDRYLFLESLLSARDVFYISYTGQSPHDNVLRRPSVVVEELLSYLDKSFFINQLSESCTNSETDFVSLPDTTGITLTVQSNQSKLTHSISSSYTDNTISSSIITKHRLQAFSKAYFDATSKLFSFSKGNFAAALNCSTTTEVTPPLFVSPLPDPDDSFKSLQLNELISFFQNPSKYILRKRLGISLDMYTRQVSDDEPFEIKGLERYKIAEKLVENMLDGDSVENSLNQYKITGLLPHGTVGDYHFEMLSGQIIDFVSDIKQLRQTSQLDNVLIDIKLQDFHITGMLDNIWNLHMLNFRYAKCKPADLLQLWIRHLSLSCCNLYGYPNTSVLLTSDGCFRFKAVHHSNEILHNLLNLYWDGLSSPLHFFPNASWEYAETVTKKKKPEDVALHCARKMWEGNDFSRVEPESADPYISKCFTSSKELSDTFTRYSLEVFGPLIEHMEQI